MSATVANAAKPEKRGDCKKLSWSYRRKKKTQNLTKTVDSNDNNPHSKNKKARIIVRNLPFKATEEDVRQLYEPFGVIEEINLLKHPDGKPVGCGFIQYQRVQDAAKAIFNTNKKEFFGRTINSSWAIAKSKFCEKFENTTVQSPTENIHEDDSMPVKTADNYERNTQPKPKSMEKQKVRNIQKEKNRKKRARIIVRNLSFEATDEHLKEHFSKYGTIEDIHVLKKETGVSIGCAFIQFSLVQSAAKAIHHANLKPLLGRPIVVDWAVPKNQFCKANDKTDTMNTVQVKEEKLSESESESKDETKVVEQFHSEDDDEKALEESEEIDENDAESDEEIVNSKKTEDESYPDQEEQTNMKRTRYESHDIAEGKTIFLKNVPFSVDNNQLKKYMEQFGPLYYALVCMDPLTEHSKGTAFVKFRNVEDAERCLVAGNQLVIGDQILEAHRALERNEVENKETFKHQNKRDSRNLYLVKEGVIQAGSPAAAGVSSADMAKRLRLEQWKSQILRNLNMFVSRIRLVVHNLPPSLDDVKFRKIVERLSNPNAVIKEARVMRDLKNLDAQGIGKSKEYGFVSFTTHEDALEALRNLNNNPNVFTANRRPIVAFSIENRIMVNAKKKRIEKSREHNPLWHGNKLKRTNSDADESTSAKKPRIEKIHSVDVKPFTGMVGKPGESKLRSKFNLKNQAQLHHETVKKEKKKNKSVKKIEAKKKQNMKKRKEVKPQEGEKTHLDDVHFNKLVNSYKNKLQSIGLNRSKWYDT